MFLMEFVSAPVYCDNTNKGAGLSLRNSLSCLFVFSEEQFQLSDCCFIALFIPLCLLSLISSF